MSSPHEPIALAARVAAQTAPRRMTFRVEIDVPGIPIQQGSKMPWGAEANPRVKSWRETVAAAARKAMPDGPLLGPVAVAVDFTFPRPKTHYRTGKFADWLRDTAPAFHTSAPDLDKLQRAIGDAMNGTVVRDDGQIAAWSSRKLYGQQPGAHIVVSTLDQGDVA